MRSAEDLVDRRLDASVCVIGAGPVGQTVATRLAAGGVDVLLLEAGGTGPERRALRRMASASPTIGDPFPDVADLVGSGIGGTAGRPAIRLGGPGAAETGIRLRPLDRVDLEPRPAVGLPGWPLSFERLWAATERAASSFGIASLDRRPDQDLLNDPRLRTALFHVADRRMFSHPELDAPGLEVLIHAPVARLVLQPDGYIGAAVVRTPAGEVAVHADVFVLATSAASTTRLLLNSTPDDEAGLANSSGMLGRGLMDHPLISAGWLRPAAHPPEPFDRFGGRFVGEDLVWPKLVADPAWVRTGEVAQSWLTLVPSAMPGRLAQVRRALAGPQGQRTGAVDAARSLADDLRARHRSSGIAHRLASVARGPDDLWRMARQGHLAPTRAWSLEDPCWAESGGRRRSYQLLQLAEQLPDPDNRLVRTELEDDLGRPRVRLRWHWSTADRRRAAVFAAAVRDALGDAGYGSAVAPVTAGRRDVEKWSTHHLSGGAVMSTDPRHGVVDRDLRSHDHPNLYIVGTATFPTVGHANPTLTAVATAVLAADAILGRGSVVPGRPARSAADPTTDPTTDRTGHPNAPAGGRSDGTPPAGPDPVGHLSPSW